MIKIQSDNKYFPNNLKKIPKSPKCLFINGNAELLNTIGIAVIGSRHYSSYGKRMCKFFVRELVKYGITIVSGMAEGIDTISHKTCLESGGKTIAVLPSGFKNIYPKINNELYKDIINLGGAVVTEYSEETEAKYNHFLERNRIVSGLCIGTLVIEAGYRSGTSVTARLTREQGRQLFAVPSSLENHKGVTSNKLIQNGAKLVTCAEDIIEQFEDIKFTKKEKTYTDSLIDNELLDVYNCLSYKPKYINDIAKSTRLSIKEVSYKLMMLELEDYIIKLRGNNYIRK